jgi:DNA polymerase III subunit epsilon
MLVLSRLLSQEMIRKLLYRKVNKSAFKTYLKCKLPAPKNEIKDTEFIVLDFETTGLDSTKDSILSIGYTVIRNNRVVLKESGHQIIRQDNELQSENVAIHQITDTDAQQGTDKKEALDTLLMVMAGKVLVAHHAEIELGFINKLCNEIYGFSVPVRVVDTMKLEKKRLERRHSGFKSNQLRLFNIRRSYGLPRYKAHNALEDAIATAEIFLVMVSKYCGEEKCQLKVFM